MKRNAAWFVAGFLLGALVVGSVWWTTKPRIEETVTYEEIQSMEPADVVDLYLPGLSERFERQASGQAEELTRVLWGELERELGEYLKERAPGGP